jgi:hypothetical protein
MNIQTVAENLKNTIAGKEMLLEEYRTQRPHSVAREMLQINIDELKRILQDVEQCEPSLPGEGNNYEKWDGDE